MATRGIVVLGSTGSIGTSTLKVVDQFPERFKVVGLVGGNNIDILAKQIKKYRPKMVSIKSDDQIEKLREHVGSIPGIEYSSGIRGAEMVAEMPEAKIVMSAIVGAAGLRPTLAAVRAGKTVALANKESMVVAGALVSRTAKENKAKILPVDSEHSAIFQALANSKLKTAKRLILTASGGPFFQKPEVNLSEVTPEEALKHPNWDMGAKITIDSATMMNKGLEIIEAKWLFDVPATKIDVVVHPQSVIHSMVEYVDGSVIAQMGVPDMCGPIAYALAYPDRLPDVVAPLDFGKMRELNFLKPDDERFPSIPLARKALQMGETYPAALNGANEVTVQAFLDRKIGFLDIPRINGEVLSSYRQTSASILEDFIAADEWGRTEANRLIQK